MATASAKGKNYGWPLVSYGNNYNGVPIAKPDTRSDLQGPVIYWAPIIAPGNLMFYNSTQTFPQWNGNGFMGGIGTQTLNRIIFDGHGGAKTAERWNVGKRIRDVATFEDPHHFSEGVLDVVVNGTPVLRDGVMTKALPGRALRGKGYVRESR